MPKLAGNPVEAPKPQNAKTKKAGAVAAQGATASSNLESQELRKVIMSRLNMSIEGPQHSSWVTKKGKGRDNYGEDDGLTEE